MLLRCSLQKQDKMLAGEVLLRQQILRKSRLPSSLLEAELVKVVILDVSTPALSKGRSQKFLLSLLIYEASEQELFHP